MALGALIDAGGDAAIVDAAVEAMRLGDEVEVEVRRETRGHVGGHPGAGATPATASSEPCLVLRGVVEDADVPDGVKQPGARGDQPARRGRSANSRRLRGAAFTCMSSAAPTRWSTSSARSGCCATWR